jgi:hypothetical protein
MRNLPEHSAAGEALQDAYLSQRPYNTPELWEALWALLAYVHAVDGRLRDVMEHNKLGDGS